MSNDRKILYLSSDRRSISSTEYKHVIPIPDLRSYKFSRVGLISASITNSFPNIQSNETNDYFTLYAKFNIKQEHVVNDTFSGEIKINTGVNYCTSDELINTLNANTTTRLNAKYFVNSEGKRCPVSIPLNNYKNCWSCDEKGYMSFTINTPWTFDNSIYIYIQEIYIIANNLSYKIFGGNFADEKIVVFKKRDAIADEREYIYTFKNRSSLIWVTSVQIRLNIVDEVEDSNILINIPIMDFYQPSIGFINPQINETSKVLKSQISNQIQVYLTNQDGWEISLKDISYNIDLLLF